MRKLTRTLGLTLSLAAVTTASLPAPAMADLIDTQTLAAQAEVQTQRDSLRLLVARDDVRTALAQRGVNAADLDARINQLTPTELLQIQQQMDALPAGSGAVSLVLSVILIFVLLDLLGATDVFPRI